MSKKMRLRPEPLHAPRATQQHAHPAPPKAHCTHADSRPCGQGAGDRGPSPGSPSPFMLHDLCACPETGLECVSSGVWRAELPRGLSPRPGSPWWDPCCGEGRSSWCLRNPAWLVGKAQRQEARNQDGRWKPGLLPLQRPPAGGWTGLAQLPCAHGGVYPAHFRGCCQSSCLLRTLVLSL